MQCSRRSLATRMVQAALAAAILFSMAATLHGQTYTVIHQFSNAGDGGAPIAGLTPVAPGKFYGSASDGGQAGAGTVFQLQLKNSSWILTPLYPFVYPNEDSIGPNTRVLVGPDGALYGTTYSQGISGCTANLGCGLVYKLRPRLTVCESALCYWNETTIYRFSGNSDGAYPEGDLIVGQNGEMIGTTFAGGNTGCEFGTQSDCGVVFTMNTGGQESVIYTFSGGAAGSSPASGVIQDATGNLYGTASQGGTSGCSGSGCGVVYELSPNGSGWTQTVLYTFQDGSDGATPLGGLVLDSAANLYGTTSAGGSGGGGTAFELNPSGGGWSFHLLYSFTAPGNGSMPGSRASLAIDTSGNLYGTTFYEGAFGKGAIFKLTNSGGSWSYASLHDFTGGTDGALPHSNVVFDSQANMYGTASSGGTVEGVAWEVTP